MLSLDFGNWVLSFLQQEMIKFNGGSMPGMVMLYHPITKGWRIFSSYFPHPAGVDYSMEPGTQVPELPEGSWSTPSMIGSQGCYIMQLQELSFTLQSK